MLALHIGVGNRGRAFLFDSWLNRHDVTVEHASDALAACVRLLQSPDQVPDLVLLGADWIGPEELLLARYVHDIWPATVVLTYGPTRDGLPAAGDALTVPVDTAVRQSAVLSESPQALVQQALARAPETGDESDESENGHPDNTVDIPARIAPETALDAKGRVESAVDGKKRVRQG